MTLDEIVEKSIPPLLIGIVFSISMLFIKVNTLENKSDELVRDMKELKEKANTTHTKQWKIVTDLKLKVGIISERCISKDTYYKDKLKVVK